MCVRMCARGVCVCVCGVCGVGWEVGGECVCVLCSVRRVGGHVCSHTHIHIRVRAPR